jgi:hypothetical protein
MARVEGATRLDSEPFVAKRAESVPQIVTTAPRIVIRFNSLRSGGIATIHEDFFSSYLSLLCRRQKSKTAGIKTATVVKNRHRA